MSKKIGKIKDLLPVFEQIARSGKRLHRPIDHIVVDHTVTETEMRRLVGEPSLT